jgi:hypothetical protein
LPEAIDLVKARRPERRQVLVEVGGVVQLAAWQALVERLG